MAMPRTCSNMKDSARLKSPSFAAWPEAAFVHAISNRETTKGQRKTGLLIRLAPKAATSSKTSAAEVMYHSLP